MILEPNHPFGEITLQMESVIKEFCRQYVILRIGDVYGEGEINPFAYEEKGITLIGDGLNYSSKVYIGDLINILIKCANELPKDIFNICDDLPIRQIEFYQYAEELNKKKFIHFNQNIEWSERIQLSSHGLRSLSIAMSNKKIKNLLNYKFLFPSYKCGLEYLFRNGYAVKTGS